MSCRGCLIAFAVVLLIGAGAVGGTYYLLSQKSSIVAGMPTVTPSGDASVTLDNKIGKFLNDLQSTSPSGQPRPVSLDITEKEATSKLSEFVESGKLPLDTSNPQVHFRGGRVQATADVKISGVPVNVAVQVKVEARQGMPQVVIEKVDVGNIGVPDAVRQQIVNAVSEALDPSKLRGIPISVDSIDVSNGVLTIKGTKTAR